MVSGIRRTLVSRTVSLCAVVLMLSGQLVFGSNGSLEKDYRDSQLLAKMDRATFVGKQLSKDLKVDDKKDNLAPICNTTPISFAATSGVSTPYPSTITVPAATGIISDVMITLTDVSHTWSSDLEVVLVGPTGAKFAVMTDIGGSAGFDTAATVTIADSGAALFPIASGAIPTGTYRPTTNGTISATGLPAGTLNQPANNGSATFASVYGGTLADGDWDLYVFDDANGDTGSIANGWCIDFTPVGGPGSVSFSNAPSVDEGDGMATVSVSRTGGTAGAISVDYSTAAGTATAGASCPGPNSDYQNVSGTLNWVDGDAADKTFSIPICEDLALETPGETINATLSMPTGGATIGTGATTVTINDAASLYRNPMGFAVPDNGQASSSITVTGAFAGINSVKVTLFDVSHTFPDDLDVLLVAPDGSTFVLLGDAGGGTDIVNQTLTFSDLATTIAPNGATLSSGVYEPANWVTPVTDFAAPAPPGPYIEPGTSLTSLGGPMMNTTFTGNANGTWNLYVRDDAGVDTGAINGGWGLELLGPTSAPATISGRVISSTGRPLKDVSVAITGGTIEEAYRTRTNHFGYFTFRGIGTGGTYVISVGSKRYTFKNPTQVFNIIGDLSGIEFNAIE